jgi:hypothetical protein
MHLTNTDLRSVTWKRLCRDLEERLADLREKNDAPALDLEQTARIRGRIFEVKQWLALRPADDSAGDIMAGLIEPGPLDDQQ